MSTLAEFLVEGSLWQWNRHGLYNYIGFCNGQWMYECLDCSDSDRQILWWEADYWWIGPDSGSCNSGNILYGMKHYEPNPTSPYALGPLWEEWTGSQAVFTSSIQLTYSLEFRGTNYQTSKHGKYTRDGNCGLVPMYRCEDCSSSDTQWIWYNTEYSWWLYGPETVNGIQNVCNTDTVGGYYPVVSDEPLWPYEYTEDGWYEYDGTSFVLNYNIGFDRVFIETDATSWPTSAPASQPVSQPVSNPVSISTPSPSRRPTPRPTSNPVDPPTPQQGGQQTDDDGATTQEEDDDDENIRYANSLLVLGLALLACCIAVAYYVTGQLGYNHWSEHIFENLASQLVSWLDVTTDLIFLWHVYYNQHIKGVGPLMLYLTLGFMVGPFILSLITVLYTYFRYVLPRQYTHRDIMENRGYPCRVAFLVFGAMFNVEGLSAIVWNKEDGRPVLGFPAHDNYNNPPTELMVAMLVIGTLEDIPQLVLQIMFEKATEDIKPFLIISLFSTIADIAFVKVLAKIHRCRSPEDKIADSSHVSHSVQMKKMKSQRKKNKGFKPTSQHIDRPPQQQQQSLPLSVDATIVDDGTDVRGDIEESKNDLPVVRPGDIEEAKLPERAPQ